MPLICRSVSRRHVLNQRGGTAYSVDLEHKIAAGHFLALLPFRNFGRSPSVTIALSGAVTS